MLVIKPAEWYCNILDKHFLSRILYASVVTRIGLHYC